MKKICIILVTLCFITGMANCQLNIIDSSRVKLWYIVTETAHHPIGSPHKFETNILKFGDKTMLDNLTFTSVLMTNDSSLTSWNTIGYIREINRKVYYRPVSRDSAFIIYDFSLGLSSKIYISNPFFSADYYETYTVSKIDSIYIGSEKRKRMYFNEDYDEGWIEGIGSIRGLIYSGVYLIGTRFELSCYSENGNVIYKNPKYENCYCTTTDIVAVSEPNNYIYSTNGVVYLKGRSESFFQLFDLLGVRILERKIDSNDINIDVTMLKSGFYLYHIKTHNSSVIGQLIINKM